MGRTLLTKPEAVIYSELGAKFPQCELSDIRQTEEWEFRNCLGWELYEAMLSALCDYSNTPSWVSQAYSIGAVVKHNGSYWVAKRGGVNTEPLVVNEFWGLAHKFNPDKDCGCTAGVKCGELYNEIWCSYLGRYLSLKLAKITIPRIAVSATGNGVVRTTGNGMLPADQKEIAYLIQSIDTQTVQAFENMMAWIKRTDREDCFGKFDQNCKPKSCEVKQIQDGCSAISPRTVGISCY